MREIISKPKFIKILGITVLAFLFGTGIVGLAQISKERAVRAERLSYGNDVIDVKKLKLSGELVCLYPRKDPVYIGVAFDEENTDYYFLLDDDAKIVNKVSLENLQIGDTVEVTFDKVTRQAKDGAQRREQRAKTIRFVKAKSGSKDLMTE